MSPLETAMHNVHVDDAQNAAKQLSTDLYDAVTLLRNLVVRADVALRLSRIADAKGLPIEQGGAIEAYMRCGLDAFVRAADLCGTVTITPEELAQAVDAIGRG